MFLLTLHDFDSYGQTNLKSSLKVKSLKMRQMCTVICHTFAVLFSRLRNEVWSSFSLCRNATYLIISFYGVELVCVGRRHFIKLDMRAKSHDPIAPI